MVVSNGRDSERTSRLRENFKLNGNVGSMVGSMSMVVSNGRDSERTSSW
jgi:hypothetical protein